MRNLILLLLLLSVSLFTPRAYAQEWTANAAFDQLFLDESLTGISTLFTHNDRVLVSAAKSDFTNRLYYSDDEGASWTEAATDNNASLYSTFASVNASTVYAFGTDLFGTRYLRKSEDAGASWTVQTSDYTNFPLIFIPTQLAASGETLILTSTARDVGLLKSADAGATWTSFITFSDGDDNKSIDDVVASGEYFFLASLTQGLYRSHKDDAGWELLRSFKTTDGIDDDIYDILVDDASGRIYIATTSSIEYSDDNGDTWTAVSRADMGIGDTGLFDQLALVDGNLLIAIADASNPRVVLVENLTAATIINEGLDYQNSSRFLSLHSTTSAAFGIRISDTSSLWQYGSGMQTSVEAGSGLEQPAVLHQNYPNPFSNKTEISFNLQTAGDVDLRVYNLLGQEIALLKNGHFPAGNHVAAFDASSLAAGVYLYILETKQGRQTRRLSIVR